MIRKYRLLPPVALLLVCSADALADTFAAKVIGIADGDTINVLVAGNRTIRVRLYGIDCPEKGQDFGTQAKKATSGLCFCKTVSVERIDTDGYGRCVGVVTAPGGVNVNQELVRREMAWCYREFAPGSAAPPKLEAAARKAKIGIWSQPNPILPWQFRQSKRSTGTAITSSKAPVASSASQLHTIYVTRTNRYYHRPGCRSATNASDLRNILTS